MSKIFKNIIWLMALLLVVSMAGCGGSDDGGLLLLTAEHGSVAPGTCTDSGPKVTSSNPTDGDVGVTTSTTDHTGKLIMVNFSEAMEEDTVTDPATFTLRVNGGAYIDGTVTMNTLHTIATFETDAALDTDTEYTATITKAAKSALGTNLSCSYRWSFTTAGSAGAGPAPINLGLATPFGMASTNGLVNVGATTLNGDVVLDPNTTCNGVTVGSAGLIGACAGAAPTVNGTVISPLYPDAGVTSLAVKNAYRQTYIDINPANLNTGVVTITGPSLGDITGNPYVLYDNYFTPGIYKTTSGGMLITGDLTLDAQGNSEAVFVFQSDSTLGMAAGAAPPGVRSRILLIGGAKASNVWWWVGSAATLGTYSEFQGNILSYSTIVLTTGATSCGRLFAGASTDGAFTFGANVVSVPGKPFSPPAGYSTTCQ